MKLRVGFLSCESDYPKMLIALQKEKIYKRIEKTHNVTDVEFFECEKDTKKNKGALKCVIAEVTYNEKGGVL